MDDFEEAQAASRHRGCALTALLTGGTLTEEQDATLRKALGNPRIDATTIAAVLGKWGYSTNESCVQRHRRGVCCRG